MIKHSASLLHAPHAQVTARSRWANRSRQHLDLYLETHNPDRVLARLLAGKGPQDSAFGRIMLYIININHCERCRRIGLKHCMAIKRYGATTVHGRGFQLIEDQHGPS